MNDGEDPTHRAEFGDKLDWNDEFVVVGSGQDQVFVYSRIIGSSSFVLDWTLVNDVTGFSLDGTWLAVRLKNNDHVQVYDLLSQDLIGETIPSTRGNTVSLSGTTLIISEEYLDKNTGHIRIFRFSNDDNDWVEEFELFGWEEFGLFGFSTAISSDGSRLAVSAPNLDGKRGSVVVLERHPDGGLWTPLGQILTGNQENAQFGFTLSMSGDGSTIITGSPGGHNGAGNVDVYKLGGALEQWQQVGPSLLGESNYRFGRVVSVASGGGNIIIAAGSFAYNGAKGFVGVYTLDDGGDDWVLQQGFHGESSRQRFGFAAMLSADGLELVVSSTWASNKDGSQTGKVDVLLTTIENNDELPSSSPPTASVSEAAPTPSPFSERTITYSPISAVLADPILPTPPPSLLRSTEFPSRSPLSTSSSQYIPVGANAAPSSANRETSGSAVARCIASFVTATVITLILG